MLLLCNPAASLFWTLLHYVAFVAWRNSNRISNPLYTTLFLSLWTVFFSTIFYIPNIIVNTINKLIYYKGQSHRGKFCSPFPSPLKVVVIISSVPNNHRIDALLLCVLAFTSSPLEVFQGNIFDLLPFSGMETSNKYIGWIS